MKKVLKLGILLVFLLLCYHLLSYLQINSSQFSQTEKTLNSKHTVPKKIANYSSEDEIKIAFGSCIKKKSSKLWKNILKQKPDIFILLGDNIYLSEKSFGKKKKILKKYKSIYDKKSFKKLRKSAKVFTIWDDHDFGDNDVDSSFPYKEASLEGFREFWLKVGGQMSDNLLPPKDLSNSVAFNINYKNIELIFTDNRSYRVNSNDKTEAILFGQKQLDWIESIVKNSQATTIVIASGGMLFSRSKGQESLDNFPQEKSRLEKIFASTKKEVLIISGDSHFANISKINYEEKEWLEFTSSPLFADVTSNKRMPEDENRVFRNNLKPNFSLITLGVAKNECIFFDSKDGENLGKFDF